MAISRKQTFASITKCLEIKSPWLAGQRWRTPLIPALGSRGRWISELKASLVYRVSSRTARATQRNPVSKETKSLRAGPVSKGECP